MVAYNYFIPDPGALGPSKVQSYILMSRSSHLSLQLSDTTFQNNPQVIAVQIVVLNLYYLF